MSDLMTRFPFLVIKKGRNNEEDPVKLTFGNIAAHLEGLQDFGRETQSAQLDLLYKTFEDIWSEDAKHHREVDGLTYRDMVNYLRDAFDIANEQMTKALRKADDAKAKIRMALEEKLKFHGLLSIGVERVLDEVFNEKT